MKELYSKFGLSVSYDDSVEMFKNKIENTLGQSRLGENLLDNDENDVVWQFNNKLGIRHGYYSGTVSKTSHLLPASLELRQYLFRLQVLLNISWDYNKGQADTLGSVIDNMLSDLPVDIGVGIKVSQKKPPQIIMGKSKKFRAKIDQTLEVLDNISFPDVSSHYSSALKELFQAKSKADLKDVVEDLLTACDSVVKTVFKDQNLGFKHLFKDDRWKKIKINEFKKVYFSDLRNCMDKIKHDVIKDYDKRDIEILLYLTSEFIILMTDHGTT